MSTAQAGYQAGLGTGQGWQLSRLMGGRRARLGTGLSTEPSRVPSRTAKPSIGARTGLGPEPNQVLSGAGYQAGQDAKPGRVLSKAWVPSTGRVPSMVRCRTGPGTERGWLTERGRGSTGAGLSTRGVSASGTVKWNREQSRARGLAGAPILSEIQRDGQPLPVGSLRNLLKNEPFGKCQNRLEGVFFGKKSKIGLEEKGRFRVNCGNLR